MEQNFSHNANTHEQFGTVSEVIADAAIWAKYVLEQPYSVGFNSLAEAQASLINFSGPKYIAPMTMAELAAQPTK